jgi:formyl-CoA transferase
MKEIAYDESLRRSKSIVEVEHKVRGKYLTVGSPIKMSGATVEITPSPLLGEHTDEVLAELGYSAERITAIRASAAV